jgi:3-deoxy-D-manno-octulosonic-acid transferase
LILAPRHPARFEEVSRDLSQAQRGFARRTAMPAEEQALSRQLASTAILLLDTIGELAGVFELADMVFIGGSLVPTGGHNVLEPAYWSKVIAFGPHMENFRDIAKLFLDAGAAIQVGSPEELAHATWLLENKEARERMGASAREVLEQNSGATGRTLEVLRKYLRHEARGHNPLSHEVK